MTGVVAGLSATILLARAGADSEVEGELRKWN